MSDQTSTIPKGWETTTLDKIAEPSKLQWKPGDKDQKYIGLEHINQGELSINGYGHSSKLESNKFYFNKGDVLFGKLRPYFRKVWKANFNGVCSTDIWVLKTKSGFDQNYLFYFVANPLFINKSMGANIGTHMPRADWHFLKNTQWNIPTLPEQQAIAALLSSLDDKIELLREQNKTLEAIAQAIFKEWFVDFEFPNEDGNPYKSSGGKMIDSEFGDIPNAWNVETIAQITSKVTKGTTPTTIGGKFSDSGINFIKAESITNDHYFDMAKFSYIDVETNELLSRSVVCEGDLLYSIAGTIGRFAVVPKSILPANTNQAVAIIRANEEMVDPFYLQCMLSLQSIRETLIGNVVEAVQANLSLTSLRDTKIIIPDVNGLNLFRVKIRILFDKIILNNSQIQTLSNIRDTLLPKLMKGEIRVKV